MECTKLNCPMQAGTPTDNCGENCPWRTIAKRGDLISRAAAIEAIGECPYNWNDWPEEIQAVNDWEFYIEAIKNVPAVDAVPVVRCGDCRMRGDGGYCPDLELYVGENFFCAAGRKVGNNEGN